MKEYYAIRVKQKNYFTGKWTTRQLSKNIGGHYTDLKKAKIIVDSAKARFSPKYSKDIKYEVYNPFTRKVVYRV